MRSSSDEMLSQEKRKPERMGDNTTAMYVALIALALLVTSLVSTPALAQQEDRNLYFQSPDGSINIIVPGGPGYVITPFSTVVSQFENSDALFNRHIALAAMSPREQLHARRTGSCRGTTYR
jgi:hypothetical protein